MSFTESVTCSAADTDNLTSRKHVEGALTPIQPMASSNGSRSVKSIVAWIESSSNSQPWSPRSIHADIKRDLSSSSVSTSYESRLYQQSVSGADDVEDYSLTYLKYRKYFANPPLGRCLDQETARTPASPADVAVKTSSGGNLLHRQDQLLTEQADGIEQSKNTNGSCRGRTTSRQLARDTSSFIQRDPIEVKAF